MSRFRWQISLPLFFSVLHLVLCLSIASGFFHEEGSWNWFLVFLIDLPISYAFLFLGKFISQPLIFIFLGSAWWLLLGRVLVFVIEKLVSKKHIG
jgi:hypothetical protein